MNDPTPVPEFSFPVAVDDVPQAGGTYAITADAEARARVATRLGLQDVAAIKATFDVRPTGAGQVSVTGTVDATLTQTCVVSLGPVPATLHEEISAVFITEDRAARDRAKAAKSKHRRARPEDDDEMLEVGLEDPPEVAQNDRIDLGEVAVVHLAVALDPYPRAPGAAFDPKVWGLDEEKTAETMPVSPFAALEKLKKPPK
jgi:uncharacterized metal-binding protein YceD (DUF177 family)